MKTIIFCKKGKPISDFDIGDAVTSFFDSEKRKKWSVSTHLVIDEVRARIREKKIPLNSIKVYVEDDFGTIVEFKIDENGRGNNWCGTQDKSAEILIRLL